MMGHTRYVDGVMVRPLRTGALAAYIDGEPGPVGIGLLVGKRPRGDIMCAVAAAHTRRVGRILVEQLAADARAANLTEVRISLCCLSSKLPSEAEDPATWLQSTRRS